MTLFRMLALAAVLALMAAPSARAQSEEPSFDGLPASIENGGQAAPLRDAQGQPTGDTVPDSSVLAVTDLPVEGSDLVPVQYNGRDGYVDRQALNPITQVYDQPQAYEVPSLTVFLWGSDQPKTVSPGDIAGVSAPMDGGRTDVLLGNEQDGYQRAWSNDLPGPSAPSGAASETAPAPQLQGVPGFEDINLSGATPSYAGSSSREYHVWATGFVASKTASGARMDPRYPLEMLGVSLPDRSALGRTVRVRLASGQTWYTVAVIDLGPWNVRDPYWDRDGVPRAAKGVRDDFGRRPGNPAGIDLTWGLWYKLLGLEGGLTRQNRDILRAKSGDVVWSFAEDLSAR